MIFAALMMLATAQDVPAAPSIEGTVARPARAADGTQRWSILQDDCAPSRVEGEILVCGTADAAAVPRLPLPGERGPPDRPMPSNPEVTGMGALAASAPPCATLSQGCTTGVDIFGMGTALVRVIGKVVDKDSCCEDPGEATNIGYLIRDVGKAFRKKPKIDKSNRIPIPLDDPAPVEPKATAAP